MKVPKKIGTFLDDVRKGMEASRIMSASLTASDSQPEPPPMAVAVMEPKGKSKLPADSPLADPNHPKTPEKKIGPRVKLRFRNALARAAQSLTLTEKRLIALCMAQINSREEHEQNKPLITALSAKTYAKEFDVGVDTAYHEMRTAANNLYERSICYYEDWKGKKLEMAVKVRWVYGLRYAKGYVELHWSQTVIPALTGLKDNYTTYKLQHAEAMRSIYSWRLLEIFESHKDTGRWEPTITEFADVMEATATQRKNFNNLRRRIIEPAIKNLVDKDGWIIDWKPYIPGARKVEGLKFKFYRDKQGKLF
jgi:plasmid replication initiation protein